jgi:UDP-N-acetylmuramoyl-L-alanyl-D-glutamate--2,6-diaminopimelate ligase
MMQRLAFEELRARVAREGLSVTTRSDEVRGGGVFVIMPPPVARGREGGQPGGESHLPQALAAGPGAVLCEEKHLPLLEACGADCAVTVTSDVRSGLGVLAASLHGTDRDCPEVIAITGTNGKTTTSYLLETLFRSLGRKVGVVGTVSYRWPGHEEEASLTTPGCLALHSLLARMREAGTDIVLMEVSSHALDQNRVAGIAFSGAVLTNLTQDHLDYHISMEDYFAAKLRLFLPEAEGGVPGDGKARAANADDPYGRRILALPGESVGYGLKGAPLPGGRCLSGEILSLRPEGMELEMRWEGRNWRLSSPLVGGFNVMNLLGAQALGLALGLRPDDFAALSSFAGVRGRLERISGKAGFNVFVDYAHTPDALVKAINALRDAGFPRVITLFGCGGNRDRSKRPLMGEAVASLSDIAVLTSDNPRDEEPEAIIADILPGLARCPRVEVEPDRRKAIALAVGLLAPGDALLVAGKGHETYQIIKGVRYPFSDQAILRECLS